MSDDLISRKRALNALYGAKMYVSGLRAGKTILSEYAKQCREGLITAIKNVPAADAEYVRHGYWIVVGKTRKGTRILKCSCCQTERKGISKSDYCRDCGAKMDLLNLSDETLNAMLRVGHEAHGYKIDENNCEDRPEPMWPKENPYLKKEDK